MRGCKRARELDILICYSTMASYHDALLDTFYNNICAPSSGGGCALHRAYEFDIPVKSTT